MKPGEEQPQNWQQPVQAPAQAPYQAVANPTSDPTSSVAQLSPAPVAPEVQQPTSAAPESQTVVPVEAPLSPVDSVETSVQGDTYVEEDVQTDEETTDTGNDVLLRWQATEYIHHERTVLWYVVLGIVVVAFIVLALLVFHSITFAILIPVMLVALVVYIRRPPSLLNYTLSRKGLHINDHLYLYDQFKAFGVVSHEELHSVVLLPRKRFQVSQTVYFPEEVGEQLVDMLAARLPMQEVQLDTIDRLLKKLRI